jgi:hypothetical protein
MTINPVSQPGVVKDKAAGHSEVDGDRRTRATSPVGRQYSGMARESTIAIGVAKSIRFRTVLSQEFHVKHYPDDT